MPEIQLLDEETGITYKINVTEDDYVRASTDFIYYTQLLAKAKASLKHNNYIEEEIPNDNEICNDGFRWVDGAVKLLLALYKERENLLNNGKLSVKKFWEIISDKLKEKSYNITGLQCKSKFHGLKKTYKTIKDHNAKNGNSRRTRPYFDIMDEMFGHKPWMSPILTLDSSSNISSSGSPYNNSDTSSSAQLSSVSVSYTQQRRRKHQKVIALEETALEKLITIVQENKEERKKIYGDTAARQNRLLHILENIANKI